MGCRTAGDIVEMFIIKHSLVCSHYARLSFASDVFKPEVDNNEDNTEESSTIKRKVKSVAVSNASKVIFQLQIVSNHQTILYLRNLKPIIV